MAAEKDLAGEDLGAINIFLFSNGQQYSPPRKYHLKAEELAWWDATLGSLARSQYSPEHATIDLYTIDGSRIESAADLRNYAVYVAVVPPDPFVQAGYDKYLLKASRSWEKRQSKRKISCEPANPDEDTNCEIVTNDSKKGTSNDQTLDENIPLEIVMSDVTEERSQRLSLPSGRKTLSEKKKPNLIQVSKRPNVPRRVCSLPPIDVPTRKVSPVNRDTPRSTVRLSRQGIPTRISTDKSTDAAKLLFKPNVHGAPYKVNDRNPLYKLKSPVRNSAAKNDHVFQKKNMSPSPKRTPKNPSSPAKDDVSLAPLPYRNKALLEIPPEDPIDTRLPSPTKTTNGIRSVQSLTKVLEDLIDESSKTFDPVMDDEIIPTKIEKDEIKNPCLPIKTNIPYNSTLIPTKSEISDDILPLTTIQSSKTDYIDVSIANSKNSCRSDNNTILEKLKRESKGLSEPPFISPIDSHSMELKTITTTAIFEEPNIIKSLTNNEVNSSSLNTVYPISKYVNNWFQLFTKSDLTDTSKPQDKDDSDKIPEINAIEDKSLILNNLNELETSPSDIESAATKTVVSSEKENNNSTDDVLTVPLIVFKSSGRSTRDAHITIQPKSDTTPLVVMVDKGDTVNLKLNIEIITAAGILKTSKTLETRTSRSLRKLSTDVTNVDDRVLTHSKSLQSVKNECTSQASGQKNENIKVYQCACCDRCNNDDVNYKVDMKTLQNTEQPCYILLPILTRPKRECNTKCPNVISTSKQEVQNAMSDVIEPHEELKINVATSNQKMSNACQTDQDFVYAEFKSINQACNLCRAGGENIRSEILIVRTEASQTATTEPCCDCGSKSCFRHSCDSQDDFTQTNWCDVLLEARTQSDGHYAFHLPPLEVLRDYDLWHIEK